MKEDMNYKYVTVKKKIKHSLKKTKTLDKLVQKLIDFISEDELIIFAMEQHSIIKHL